MTLAEYALQMSGNVTDRDWYTANETKLYDQSDILEEYADVLGPTKHHSCEQLLKTDAEFIAASRTLVPELARRLQALCTFIRDHITPTGIESGERILKLIYEAEKPLGEK